ncbi:hypothetical protein AB8880_02210 [Alphaproteobacteria bacterium LSUCC0684]
MTTRLEIAFQRLEAAVESLEKRQFAELDARQMESSPGAANPNMQNGEINAIRQLVDQALMILAEEKKHDTDAGGGGHD